MMFEFSFLLCVVGDCAELTNGKGFRESERVFILEFERGLVC